MKGKTIEVLDHGFARLVDYMGSDLAISRAARVSYDAPPREEDTKLIRYLMQNHHTSPFEAVVFTFEIKAPIFVFRQWHRHRTWSYNELSARYAELPEEFYVPDPKVMGQQSASSKQARDLGEFDPILHTIPEDREGPAVHYTATDLMGSSNEDAFSLYHKMLEAEIPRELARSVLPLSTYSRMFATVDLHNLFHFLRLRLHKHSQYEIRVYARALLDLITTVCPIASEAFTETLSE